MHVDVVSLLLQVTLLTTTKVHIANIINDIVYIFISIRNRGRRGDISLRLGGRVKFPEEESAVADDRLNQYADEFLAELESTFSRREKAIPRTKMYSDFYERETLTEKPWDSDRRSGGGSGRHRDSRDRDSRGDGDNDRGGRRRGGNSRRDNTASFTGAAKAGPSGGRDRSDDHRPSREAAMKALDARLGLPADLDEYGRSQRN
jgi:hypothetical protein